MSDTELVEITPDESVAPVFLDTTPQTPLEAPPDLLVETEALRQSAIDKFEDLGITEDELRAFLGLA